MAATKPVREIIKYGDGTVKAQGQRLDGSLMRSGSFDRGRQVGVWNTFTRDGDLVKSTDFGK